MNEEKGKDRFELRMPLENISGKYSNYMRVGHSATEFILDFCLMEGTPNSAHIIGRIIVSPAHIKNFINALNTNVENYESAFQIKLPSNPDEYMANGIKKIAD